MDIGSEAVVQAEEVTPGIQEWDRPNLYHVNHHFLGVGYKIPLTSLLDSSVPKNWVVYSHTRQIEVGCVLPH